jgi:hypothetical protein
MTGRRIAAVIAANLAGPCLLVLHIFLLTAFTDPSRLNASDGAHMLMAFGVFLLMTWAGMAVTVFPASLLFAWLGWRAGWRSAWIYIAAGVVIGGVFNVLIPPLIFGSGEQTLSIFAFYGCLGAICGWIYWRIAIRQTPDSARPITTP